MASHSYGGVVRVDWAGGSSFTNIAEVVSFTPPELSITKSPGWHLLSPDAFKSKIPGMVDADDAAMTLRFTRAQYDSFLDHLRVIAAWRIEAGDNDTIVDFDGFLCTVGGPDHQDDDTIMQSVAVCCNTIPVVSQGSGSG